MKPISSVSVQLSGPDFGRERRYVLLEKEFARTRMKALPKRGWLFFSYPAVGLLRRVDWKHYLAELEKYDHQLDAHERDIERGIVPVKFVVRNVSGAEDRSVRVRIKVEHGTVDSQRQPPKRPTRVDGAVNDAKPRQWRLFSRFARRRVRIEEQLVQAEFSYLGPGESEDLIKRPVYLHSSAKTRLTYELHSHRVRGVSGKVADWPVPKP